MTDHVTTSIDGHVATVVIDRAPHNHVNAALIHALADVLDAHGFSVVHGHGAPAAGLDEDAFRHRVDASIDRDIVVARKG